MDSNTALENFKRCADDAPEGMHAQAKALDAVIGEACINLMKDVRALGLKANNCDLIYEVEAAMYDYVKRSNPDATLFPLAEGFGAAMAGEARERVLVQATRDRDYLRSAGMIA